MFYPPSLLTTNWLYRRSCGCCWDQDGRLPDSTEGPVVGKYLGWYIHIFGQSHSQIKLGFDGVKTIHYGTYDRFVVKPFIKVLNVNLRTTLKHLL